ncbi:restriction endonuclease subunit S [Lactococcus garvieae]
MMTDTLLDFIQNVDVEWKALGEVARLKNGSDWKNLPAGEIPVYGSGGEMGVSVGKAAYDKPTVLIPRKGSISNLFYVTTQFWNVDTIYYTEIDEEKIIPKFFYYFLKTANLESLSTNPTRPSLTQAILDKVKIPIPSLEIQQKVVEILDKMTDYVTELTAELTLRQKQYAYYRDQLLTFGAEANPLSDSEESLGVRWTTLREIADIGTGSSNTNEQLEIGKYPFYVRSQEVRFKDEYEFDEVATLTSGDGVGVGKIYHFVQGKYALHQRAYRIHITNSQVDDKYFFYFFQNWFTKYIEMQAVNSSVTSVRKPMLEKFQVAIPNLVEQKRIVKMLDKFDKLTSDLSEGLPREIELRQKQYEYWREQLLSFK